MDLIFVSKNRRPFTIEVGFFDSVLEIKEKVEKYQGIPVSDQTLVFKDHVLPDDGNIAGCNLYHNAIINLIIAKKTVHVHVKISTPMRHVVTIEMYVKDTVLDLKKKILAAKWMIISANNLSVMAVHFNGQELQNNRTLHECGVSDHVAEITLSFKLRVTVRSTCGTKWSTVEVDPFSSVLGLRKELRTLEREVGFPLPLEFFFVHGQSPMREDMSFWSHRVGHGDTIAVFPGRLTGGPRKSLCLPCF